MKTTKPKKAQTKAKEHKFPKDWGKVDGTIFGAKLEKSCMPDHRVALDVAIERGERLEAIAELSGAWIRRDGYSGATALRLLKRIYKLAKPVGVPIPQPPRIMV